MQYSILCLFDSDSAIERLRLLAGSNCTVIAVKTVLGALQEFKKCNADMVLVQVGLKDESCFDFLRAAQPLAEGKNVPMVAVSLDDVYHDSIEFFIAKSCRFFGCECYLRNEDFNSDALRFVLTRRCLGKSVDKTPDKVCV